MADWVIVVDDDMMNLKMAKKQNVIYTQKYCGLALMILLIIIKKQKQLNKNKESVKTLFSFGRVSLKGTRPVLFIVARGLNGNLITYKGSKRELERKKYGRNK